MTKVENIHNCMTLLDEIIYSSGSQKTITDEQWQRIEEHYSRLLVFLIGDKESSEIPPSLAALNDRITLPLLVSQGYYALARSLIDARIKKKKPTIEYKIRSNDDDIFRFYKIVANAPVDIQKSIFPTVDDLLLESNKLYDYVRAIAKNPHPGTSGLISHLFGKGHKGLPSPHNIAENAFSSGSYDFAIEFISAHGLLIHDVIERMDISSFGNIKSDRFILDIMQSGRLDKAEDLLIAAASCLSQHREVENINYLWDKLLKSKIPSNQILDTLLVHKTTTSKANAYSRDISKAIPLLSVLLKEPDLCHDTLSDTVSLIVTESPFGNKEAILVWALENRLFKKPIPSLNPSFKQIILEHFKLTPLQIIKEPEPEHEPFLEVVTEMAVNKSKKTPFDLLKEVDDKVKPYLLKYL